MASCYCFDGLRHGKKDLKDQRSRKRSKDMTAEQVFTMVHPRPGSWFPGKQKPPMTAQNFASPTPNFRRPEVQLDCDSELRRPDVNCQQRSKFQVEQLVAAPGTLPPALPAHERERIIRKLLPTVTHEMLAALRPELVEATGIEGQTLRRKLVEGATVVFLTAGYEGKRFVFERAHQLGIKSVVIEHPDSWCRDLVDEGIIAKFIPVDMSQPSAVVFEESLAAIRNLGEDGLTGRADAVCTLVELSVPIVARMCERLGLPGPSPAAVDAARSKYETRKVLKAAGLPTPANMLIRSEADFPAAAKHVGFPAVLKPVSGAASLGVKKVMTEADLKGCYEEVIDELSGLVVVSGALVQGDGTRKGVDAASVVDMAVLLEQYLDGQEVDVDVVVSEGKWRYAGVTDNGPTLEPYFNETWGVCPSLMPIDAQRELKELAVQSVEALGFSCGVFHVECKYTSRGPHLIEVNARMGGGPVHEMNLRCWGVDLVEEAIFISLGIPSRPDVTQEPLVSAAYYMVPATKSGTVKSIPACEELENVPGVVWAKPLVNVGDIITGPDDGMPTWVLALLVEGKTATEARDYVWQLESENKVRV